MPVTLNDPAAPISAVRSPRLRVLLNGVDQGGCLHISVNSNNHYQADSFEAEFVADQPGVQPLAWWSQQDKILVEIQADIGYGGQHGTFETFFTGEVDGIDADPIAPHIALNGRDLSRRFIDSKTQETFLNQTSSQIAETLAARRGLTAAATPTKTPVSRYYALDHDAMTANHKSRFRTEWDLLTSLAQLEGFDVFVAGTTLYFQPPPSDTAPPFVVRVDKSSQPDRKVNAYNLRLQRSLTLARDIEVWVQSWNASQKSGFIAKAGGKQGQSGSTSASAGKTSNIERTTVISRPNMTLAQAQMLANSIREDLTKHERLFDFDLPGYTGLGARSKVRLEGTGTSWDQDYFVASITWSLAVREGFSMSVKCKNHSPLNETIIIQ